MYFNQVGIECMQCINSQLINVFRLTQDILYFKEFEKIIVDAGKESNENDISEWSDDIDDAETVQSTRKYIKSSHSGYGGAEKSQMVSSSNFDSEIRQSNVDCLAVDEVIYKAGTSQTRGWCNAACDQC